MENPRPNPRSETGPFPIDLGIVIGITLALNASVFVPVLRDTPLRIPLGIVFLYFVPGYALVAVFYPEGYRHENATDRTESRSSIRRVVTGAGVTPLERALLSIGCSVVVVPAIGYLVNFTRFGIRLAPVLLAVSGFTIVTAFVATYRRRRLPPGDRFTVPSRYLTVGPVSNRFAGTDRTTVAVRVLLAASILVFAASVGYAVIERSPDEQYSELYLLAQDGERFVDGNSSIRLEPGESRELTVGVSNHEGRPTTYTVIVVEQVIERAGNRTVVREQIRHDRFEMRLPDGERRLHESTVDPTTTGSNSRIVWLLYTGDVPAEVSTSTAEYHAYVWISGRDSDETPAR